jgi:hypothetical protein
MPATTAVPLSGDRYRSHTVGTTVDTGAGMRRKTGDKRIRTEFAASDDDG